MRQNLSKDDANKVVKLLSHFKRKIDLDDLKKHCCLSLMCIKGKYKGTKFKLDGQHTVFGSEKTIDTNILNSYFKNRKYFKYNKIEGIPPDSQFDIYFNFKTIIMK